MTRPMPGPPECLPNGFPHVGVAIDAPTCLLHAWIDRDWGKHLTDAEVAAEYWREQAEWWSGMLQKGRTAEDVDLRRVATWHRFATRPMLGPPECGESA